MVGQLVKVDGHKGVWQVMAQADDKVGHNFWCLPIAKGGSQPDYTHGWRAFHKDRLTVYNKPSTTRVKK